MSYAFLGIAAIWLLLGCAIAIKNDINGHGGGKLWKLLVVYLVIGGPLLPTITIAVRSFDFILWNVRHLPKRVNEWIRK